MANLKRYLKLLEEYDHEGLKELIKADLTTELMKEIGGNTLVKKHNIIKKYIKKSILSNPERSFNSGTKYIESENMTVVCNGYSLHMLYNTRFEDLETSKAMEQLDYKKVIDYNNKTAQKIDIDKILPDLKLQAKLNNLENPYVLEINNHKMGFNPTYLLNAIELLELKGESEIFVNMDNKVEPIIIKNKIGLSMVLPVRMN